MTTWSFVVIPDTQHLATPSRGWSAYYDSVRDWVLDHQDEHDIRLVMHEGDIVDVPADPDFAVAETALSPLFDLDIPVLVFAAGNHDIQSVARLKVHTRFNSYFGPGLYESKPYFGGVFEAGQAQNLYIDFTVGDRDYLAFGLEFFPRAAVLNWCQQVATAHPGHDVLVVTHSYLYTDGTRTGPGDANSLADYNMAADDAHDGEGMWDGWFRDMPNLLGVFSGHHLGPPYLATRIDDTAAREADPDTGNSVFQGFFNWQSVGVPGNTRVVLVEVDDEAMTFTRRVFVAYTGAQDGDQVTHQLARRAPTNGGAVATLIRNVQVTAPGYGIRWWGPAFGNAVDPPQAVAERIQSPQAWQGGTPPFPPPAGDGTDNTSLDARLDVVEAALTDKADVDDILPAGTTAGTLAAGDDSRFTSLGTRIDALVPSTVRLSAIDLMSSGVNATTLSASSSLHRPAHAFAATLSRTVASKAVVLPASWATYKVDAVVSADSATGNVALALYSHLPATGGTWNPSLTTVRALSTFSVTPVLTYQPVEMATGLAVPAAGQPIVFVLERQADDAGDVNAGFIRLYELILTRLT